MTHVAFGLDHKGPVTRPRTFGTTRGPPVSASTAIVARVRREPQDSELLVNSKVLKKFFEKTTEAAAVAEQLPQQRRGK